MGLEDISLIPPSRVTLQVVILKGQPHFTAPKSETNPVPVIKKVHTHFQ